MLAWTERCLLEINKKFVTKNFDNIQQSFIRTWLSQRPEVDFGLKH